ncbi:hypothetical protein K1T71_007054 [Dendrolimus kikuchii]|uniref:Uncharacterized protein n=1 Tax=Dendrolimus kikuchii TaxID=765133 RepID=A0ACC1CZJ6_9NEOP|nr:hypothetical protein K1T71_007054 [Dendrolimus kikuchii]
MSTKSGRTVHKHYSLTTLPASALRTPINLVYDPLLPLNPTEQASPIERRAQPAIYSNMKIARTCGFTHIKKQNKQEQRALGGDSLKLALFSLGTIDEHKRGSTNRIHIYTNCCILMRNVESVQLLRIRLALHRPQGRFQAAQVMPSPDRTGRD